MQRGLSTGIIVKRTRGAQDSENINKWQDNISLNSEYVVTAKSQKSQLSELTAVPDYQ